jgi:hypothetical protein
MASEEQVKSYLGYWFQLGKKVFLKNGREQLLPDPVVRGNSYSEAFENCWQRILEYNGRDCYLEGTIQTIEQLLSPVWEINPCSRCEMPVPTIDLGMPSLICPCNDLPNWPNTELPKPRSPVDSSDRLSKIQERLKGLEKAEGRRQKAEGF